MTTQDVRVLADAIASMTVSQAASLAEYLKETYRIEAPQGVSVVRTVTTVVNPLPDEIATTVDVLLADAGPKKISVIKVVRAETGLGLKEAKDLVDGAPKIIKAGIDRAEADKLRAELEREGAKVELK